MSDTYTPTMKSIEDCYVYSGENYDGSLRASERQLRAEFAAALAAHDAEVAAKALSDMADELMLSHDGGRRDAGAHSKSAASSAAQKRAMQQVRARAAEYRKAVKS